MKKARFYITTKQTTLKASNETELYDILRQFENPEDIEMIETYSSRWGYTDVTLKYLAK